MRKGDIVCSLATSAEGFDAGIVLEQRSVELDGASRNGRLAPGVVLSNLQFAKATAAVCCGRIRGRH